MAEVTVLLPVRDAEEFVGDALRSCLEQQGADLDVLVVDDGSTDGTLREVERVADGRVRVVEGRRAGVGAALVTGLAQVSAPFVCRMDADDVCLPGRVRHQLEHLRADPGCGLVGGQVQHMSARGGRLPRLHGDMPQGDRACRLQLAFANCFAHPAVMLRTEAVQAVGGYVATAVFEDYDLWLRLAQQWRTGNVAPPVLRYRYHRGNTYTARRAEAAHQLAPMIQRYAASQAGLQVGRGALEVLLAPARELAHGDADSRQDALDHLAAVLRHPDLGAVAPVDRRAVKGYAHRLALQIAAPAWRRGHRLRVPAAALATAPRTAIVAVSRRLADRPGARAAR